MSEELVEFQNTLAELKRGGEDAAWRLTQTYAPHVIRVIRRRKNPAMQGKLNTSDFLQMVWQSFFRKRELLENITTPDDLIRLLVTMARNKVADEARRQFQAEKYDIRREQPIADDELMAGQPDDTPYHLAVTRECWDKLMAGQSDRNRRILQMRLEGRTYVEIAEILGIHERTARKVLNRLLSAHNESVHREQHPET